MAFVPVITPPPAPSPRAIELGNRIAQQVREFQSDHPDLGGDDVSQAFRIARTLLQPQGSGRGVLTALALTLGLLLAGFLALVAFRGGALPAPGIVGFMVIILGFVAVLAVLLRTGGPRY